MLSPIKDLLPSGMALVTDGDKRNTKTKQVGRLLPNYWRKEGSFEETLKGQRSWGREDGFYIPI